MWFGIDGAIEPVFYIRGSVINKGSVKLALNYNFAFFGLY